MSFNIVVPDLGESVTEATVAKWLKQAGDPVSVGEAILTLETEKVDLEVGAEKDGVLSSIAAQEGADVKVGDVLGVIDESSAGAAATSAQAVTPTAQTTPEDASKLLTNTSQSAPEESTVSATPVAKRVASENAVDLSQVEPGKPGGPCHQNRCRALRPKLNRRPLLLLLHPQNPLLPQRLPPKTQRPSRRMARRGTGQDVPPPPYHRPASGRSTAHRSHAHHLQRNRHDRCHGTP